MPDYAKIAKESRIKCLELVYKAQTSHIGSLLSCADIMAVLSEKIDWDKDKFVLSAGWKAAMLYYHLWRKRRITGEDLNSYCQPGSKWIGLAEPVCKEIVIAGGSMGLGLPGAVGLALAKKLKGENGTVYCLMSDGELQIGTTWESALIAAHHRLDNLVVIVDNNGLQAMGATKDILSSRFPLASSTADSFWRYYEVDGHAYNNIEAVIEQANPKDKPVVLVCNTIKGKGVSFMEGNNLYHYKAPSEKEYELALKELNG